MSEAYKQQHMQKYLLKNKNIKMEEVKCQLESIAKILRDLDIIINKIHEMKTWPFTKKSYNS
ncbi:MAG: hypothetical protein KIH08_07465 [Candidatus Freyarchaeota archaeon]|nr:hypothetical protein [Candidatus Jordarchaeia archaeon]MBS7269640.1 hypothetical protein [Candidatus Jordarchaeia archaeon]MBS7280411.1 hypothetical protein [Candidatus Jordarchaeia archaeon]